ncbi:MAG: pilus assembly protein TadG-related protein [Bdellovibrionales bacterium]
MATHVLRNSRGQVAIFVALLFQVLFLFFAMIVNVGLLIHHKVNLQNSVDIAAYYGAMKQAEVLNAIAHVNYQIRQSWKLLVWRHRVLGSAGAEAETRPSLPLEKLLSNQSALGEVLAGNGNPDYMQLYKRPRFCIAYAPHEVQGSSTAPGQADNENTCKRSYLANHEVRLPDPNVLIIPGFIRFGITVGNAIRQAISNSKKRCANVGALNYFVGGKFILAHTLDSEERMRLIKYLADGISTQSDDFFEISGQNARQGIEKTLLKNLTAANRESVEFRVLNGFAQGQCRASGGQVGSHQDLNLPPWLVPIEVYPVWLYADCAYRDAGAVDIRIKARQLDSFNTPEIIAQAQPDLRTNVEAIQQFLRPRPTLVGFEKDPWCAGYVGIKATARPKIPFMPLSEVEISAEAYSKPFGGRIGPWYFRNWQPSQAGQARINETANSYNRFQMLEPNGPVRVTNLGSITSNIDDPSWVPNLGRFAGDGQNEQNPGGYAVERVLGYFHRAILNPATYTALGAGATYPFQLIQDAGPSLNYYDSIGNSYNTPEGEALDQLSWSVPSNGAPKLRLLEIAGIAPNLFDLAYYSIDPDFYNNYYKVIQAGLQNRPGWDSRHRILGDLGSRFRGEARTEQFNIFDQMRIQRDLTPGTLLDSDIQMPFMVKNPVHLLNSWSVDTLKDYRTSRTNFGKCYAPLSGQVTPDEFEKPLDPPVPGNCVDGGRVGYSVKLVSRKHLQDSSLPLGGENAPPGPLRNPPPDNW